ncbi:MAG: sulfate ABC transporter permease subunit CysW [Leptospiraceae bacterium]|nr:sulfate ABC transporter permease subunit CysW [Leptospiraceae bacterium]
MPSKLLRYALIFLSVFFLSIMILIPVINVFYHALEKGLSFYLQAISHSHTISALLLNLTVAIFTIPLNLSFGVAAAILITRFDFFGKNFLLSIIDLPFSVSPVIAGLIFILVFSLEGWWGEWLEAKGLQVIFATPGIILATIFVTFPFVVREVIPVLEASGDEEEQAAFTLGANSWQTFFHITIPKIKWGLLYGVVLCTAKVMGEFGAVSLVSGHIAGLTDTLPLRVEKLYNEYQTVAAFSVASILILFSVLIFLIKLALEKRMENLQ